MVFFLRQFIILYQYKSGHWVGYSCAFVQGEVRGLCGNFDGDGQNDFTTQGQLVVDNPLEFANSWKVTSSCPDVEESVDACEAAPQRHQWAKMMCSIIIGTTFKDCHHKVQNHCLCDWSCVICIFNISNCHISDFLFIYVWQRLIHFHLLKTVWKTRVPATPEETVSASAQLWQPTLKLVMRLMFALHGELQTFAVSECFCS